MRHRVGGEAADPAVLEALARTVLAIATSDDPATVATTTALAHMTSLLEPPGGQDPDRGP